MTDLEKHSSTAAVPSPPPPSTAPTPGLFATLEKVIDSDAATKWLFDHFRNVGIAGAFLAAGAWFYNTPANQGFAEIFRKVLGASMLAVAALLLVIVFVNGMVKAASTGVLGPKRWTVVLFVYVLAMCGFFMAAGYRLYN